MEDYTLSETSDQQMYQELLDTLANLGISEEDINRTLWEMDHPKEYNAMMLQRWKEHMNNIFADEIIPVRNVD